MVREIGAFVAGMIAGSIVNMGLIQLNSTVLFPMPEGMDPNDMAAFATYVETLPAVAFLVVMAAHLGQAFVGGWVAARISDRYPMQLALGVAALTLVGGLMMLFMLPGPLWMWLEIPLYLVFGYAAGKLEVRRRQ